MTVLPVLRAASGVVAGGLALQSWYSLVLLTAGLPRILARGRGPQRLAPADAPEFVVLIPAHDEEQLIATAVNSVLAASYPGDRLACIVIADNCTDQTAALAEQAGAEVWPRTNLDLRGKGHALEWAIDRVLAERPSVSAIFIVDADCTVDAHLFVHAAEAFLAGADAVQTDYLVSNADASHVAALRAAAFALVMGVRPAGKEALGLSAGLFGTGMAFSAETLRQVPWQATSLTEDAEYQIRLVAGGRRVRYLGDTHVASPMPVTAQQARSQEERWEGGRVHLAKTFGPALIGRGIKERSWALLDAIGDVFVLPQSLLTPATAGSLVASLVLRSRWSAAIAASGLAAQIIYVVGGLLALRSPAAVWLGLLRAPALIARKVVLKLRLTATGGPSEFVRTDRADH